MGSLSAQSFSKQVATLPGELNNTGNADTLKILAVMVDFQADKYDATTGTGKFGSHYTKTYGDTILDPLPHDASYFSDHLLFAKNYYKKVSKGKLDLTYKVLPQVITVSKYMRDYSPGYNSSDLSPLGYFAQEVWNLAENKFTDVKFSDYNLFVIFHAGVSQGLDLGTFSINRNMPSVYLGITTLKKIFNSQFNGFQMKTGLIKNSIILPETESREQDFIDGTTYLNQVSINGEVVNNIGNHLGLPDLFNTTTGISAIGRFGLMDAQSIGANYGMFPPEPSPWEKIYLGWDSPKLYSGSTAKINIATGQTASINDTTILKVPINSQEYFLVENRQQDALKNNMVLTIKKKNQIVTQSFTADTTGYYNITPEKIHGGVVIDVDEFDASTPGNGIVIWHIDEKIINSKIADNKINADPDNRGIFVVEADGVQEIGQKFETVFGTMIGDGNYQDFWYKGNKAKYYTNKFGPDTKPNTKSNSGANSLLSFENFSSLSNKMSFNISLNQAVTKYQLPLNGSVKTMTQLSNGTDNFLFITNDAALYKYNFKGEKLFSYDAFSNFKPAAIYYNNTEVVAGVIGNKINVYIKTSNDEFVRTLPVENVVATAPPVISYNAGNPFLYVGYNTGILKIISIKNLLDANFTNNDITLNINYSNLKSIAAIDDQYAVTTPDRVFLGPGNYLSVLSPVQIGYSKSAAGKLSLIVLGPKNNFYVFRGKDIFSSFSVSSTAKINSFSLGQVDKSGENSILISNGNKLEAYSIYGKLVDGFPIRLSQNSLSGSPLTVDLDASNSFETVSINSIGDISFAGSKGKLDLIGGQFNAGSNQNTLMTLFTNNKSTSLATLDELNRLSIWTLSNSSSPLGWTNIYGSETNSLSAIANIPSSLTNNFFPSEKAYNWPNPVYGNSTNIRFFVSADAGYTVRIFDLGGSLVYQGSGRAIGGTDNEIIWDVTKIQSGVYYANLEVVGSDATSANKIIKIVVIK